MRRPRSRSLGDLDAVDVLLVEDDDRDVAADEMRTVLHELALEAMAWRATWPGESRTVDDAEVTHDPEGPGWARRAARRYRRRAVAGAVVAVAVAATTAVVDARQTAARAAALAAAPAVLADASSAPAEVWRVPGRVVSDQDDRLLVADGGSLRAVDPGTGETIWTASAAAGGAASTGHCLPVDESLRPDRAPDGDGPGPRGLVACVGAPPGDGPPEGGATVVVVDTTTGRTRQTLTVGGAPLLVEPVGRDLLVAAVLADGGVRVTRWDLATGTPRWDSVSTEPVLTAGATTTATATAERRPGSLTVGGFAVDLATGDRLDAASESARPYPYEEHALPGGAHVTWAWTRDGTSGRGRVVDVDAGWSYLLPGPPLRPAVTDGSDGRVLVVRTSPGDRLRGLDMRTGRMRWSRFDPGTAPPRATALVGGVMLVDGGATVTALDVRTGDTVWSTPVEDGATDGTALTDGRVVLLPVCVEDGDVWHLAGYRITDGAEVWRGRTPPGTVSLSVVDHHLVASTDDEVIGLG